MAKSDKAWLARERAADRAEATEDLRGHLEVCEPLVLSHDAVCAINIVSNNRAPGAQGRKAEMAKRKVTKKATSKSKATGAKSKRSAAVATRNAKIVAAYNKGATAAQLSEKFNLSTIMVYRYLKALGVSLRPRAAAKPKVAKATKADKAKAAKNAKVSKAAIAKGAKELEKMGRELTKSLNAALAADPVRVRKIKPTAKKARKAAKK